MSVPGTNTLSLASPLLVEDELDGVLTQSMYDVDNASPKANEDEDEGESSLPLSRGSDTASSSLPPSRTVSAVGPVPASSSSSSARAPPVPAPARSDSELSTISSSSSRSTSSNWAGSNGFTKTKTSSFNRAIKEKFEKHVDPGYISTMELHKTDMESKKPSKKKARIVKGDAMKANDATEARTLGEAGGPYFLPQRLPSNATNVVGTVTTVAMVEHA